LATTTGQTRNSYPKTSITIRAWQVRCALNKAVQV
jgi:hypothetical protein